MQKGRFKKIKGSGKPMYGPRAVLICGFASEEHEKIAKFFKSILSGDPPVVFATDADGPVVIKELISRPDQSGCGMNSGSDRTVVLSGLTEKELLEILAGYRERGLPRPLWATLTPVSEAWNLSALIRELCAERRAMEKKPFNS